MSPLASIDHRLKDLVESSYARRDELPLAARVSIIEAQSRIAGPEARNVGRELEELAEKAGDDPRALPSLVRLASLGLDRGELPAEVALRFAGLATRAAPKDPQIRIHLADVFERLGDEAAALAQLQLALEHPDLQGSFAAQFKVGVLSYNQRRFEEAEAAYRRALHIRPSPRVHLYLADALRNLGRRDSARHHYLEALRRDHLLVDALRGYWALSTDDLLRESLLDKFIRRLLEAPTRPLPLNRWLRPITWALLRWHFWRHPQDARLHFMLGYCALLRRDYAFAEERLMFAYLLPPRRDFEALVLAAVAKGLQGRLEDAAAVLEEGRQFEGTSETDAYERDMSADAMFGRLVSPFFWEPKLGLEPHAPQVFELVVSKLRGGSSLSEEPRLDAWRQPEPKVEVWWGWETSDDRTAIEEIFRSEGVNAVGRVVEQPVGNGVGFYVTAVLVGISLEEFLLGARAAQWTDAWEGAKHLVVRLHQWFNVRYPQEPPYDLCVLALEHPDTRTSIHLRSDMPDAAFRMLSELPFPPGTTYTWDESRHEWEAHRRTRKASDRIRAWLRYFIRR